MGQNQVRKLTSLGIIAVIALSGCVDLTGRSAAQLAPLQVEAKPRFARQGHVYCILGWLGVWSRGMDVIAERLQREVGVHATSLANQEWKVLAAYIVAEHKAGRWSEPLVLVGHSYGCDDQVRVAKRLHENGISVDLLLLVDPTTPGAVSPNVKRCVDIYKSHPGTDVLPFFRGIKVKAADPSRTQVTNIDLRLTDVGFPTAIIDHFNIAKIPGVQDMVLAEVKKTCWPRTPAQTPARKAVR